MENKQLNFTEFLHSDALIVGFDALDIVKQRQLRRIGIRIMIDDKLVFQFLMDGKNEDNYLKGKEKVVKKTHRSSMEVFEHKDEYNDLCEDSTYCVSGGAIPIIVQGEVCGSISISGMTQELDHALACEVLQNLYGKKYSITESD